MALISIALSKSKERKILRTITAALTKGDFTDDLLQDAKTVMDYNSNTSYMCEGPVVC